MDLKCALSICKLVDKQLNGYYDNINILSKTNVEDYLKEENCEWEYNFKNNTKDCCIHFTNISFFSCCFFVNENRISIFVSHRDSSGEYIFTIKHRCNFLESDNYHGLFFRLINNNINCLFNWKDMELI